MESTESAEHMVMSGDYPEYLARAWAPVEDACFWRQAGTGLPGYANWAVWSTAGVDADTGEVGYSPKVDKQGWTTDPDEAIRSAHGEVKWDGCTNYVVIQDENCMVHGCDPMDVVKMCEAVVVATAMAARIVGVEVDQGVSAPLSLPS